MAVRILTSMYAVGIMDNKQTGNLNDDVRSKAHDELARGVAEASTVLLRNDGILPLSKENKKLKIAVIGDDAKAKVIATGGGSGHVICPYVISPFDGISQHLSDPAKQVTYTPTHPIANAVKAAAEADIAIVFVGVSSHEGADRPNLDLGSDQDKLIEAVAFAQKNTVVVANCPGAVLMPWVEKTRAVVAAWLPGQEDGAAIANVLFGDVNPGGKLPVTFPINNTQNPLHTKIQYPGINGDTEYSEKLLVGYRWYDAVDTDPLFPFGHGLSYTTFRYDFMKVTGKISADGHGQIEVGVRVTNNGNADGQEVPQLYLAYPKSAGEPPKVLRGFAKTRMLKPGEHEEIQFHIKAGEPVSIWDAVTADWKSVPGTFEVLVGSSSRDIRTRGQFTVE
jgi:beta-glucosidase